MKSISFILAPRLLIPTRLVESDDDDDDVEIVSSSAVLVADNLVELLGDDGNEDVEKALQLLL